jgi:K+-sensing histidine kinase KdpD
VLGTSHVIPNVLQSGTGSLNGGDQRWFKSSTRKKRSVTGVMMMMMMTMTMTMMMTMTTMMMIMTTTMMMMMMMGIIMQNFRGKTLRK